MAAPTPAHLGDLTTLELAALLSRGPVVGLLPVGSIEPHGPHLPLATDNILSEGACLEGARILALAGVTAVVCPTIPFGVTDFAAGFAGAVSVRSEALTSFVQEVVRSILAAGLCHVCIVNNHLEPAQDEAIRAVQAPFPPGTVSVACPLDRKYARTLSAEFKRGACHAGEYETSLMMALAPKLVHSDLQAQLSEVSISLSTGIRDGKKSFREMGMNQAYAGAPAVATAEHGSDQLHKLGTMIASEVALALGQPGLGQ